MDQDLKNQYPLTSGSETVTFVTDTSSKIPRPRLQNLCVLLKFLKNVVITSKLNFFKFLAFFLPVLFFYCPGV